jgi:sugar phosphate isomerase/epimerase
MKPGSRREFLLRSGALAATLAAGGFARRADSTPMGRPVGIQLYAVNSALQENPAATLKSIKDIGYGEVETAGFAKLSAKEFRKLLDDAGLTCPSGHLQFDLANLGPTFEDAHAIGMHYVASGGLRGSLTPPITGPMSAMSLDEAKRTAELANKIGAKAKQAGLRYAYHNHNIEFADHGGVVGFDILLRDTDPELVKFEIDCGWMVLGNRNPVDYFKKYPNRFPMIHVKDFLPPPDTGDAVGKTTENHAGAELGRGMIDYRPIFAAAEKAGLQHYFVEQEGPFVRMTQLQAAKQAYVYLSAIG